MRREWKRRQEEGREKSNMDRLRAILEWVLDGLVDVMLVMISAISVIMVMICAISVMMVMMTVIAMVVLMMIMMLAWTVIMEIRETRAITIVFEL
jgi:hypothetical protein